MKLSEKKILVLEMLSIIVLLLNVFAKNIMDEWTINIFLIVTFAISIFLLGFEKNKIIDKKKVLVMVILYSISILIVLYGIGMFLGFVKSAYSSNIIVMFVNILPITIMTILSELLRYNILKKSNGKKLIFVLSILMFTLVYMTPIIGSYDLTDLQKVLELGTVMLLPQIARNYLLSDFSFKYGYIPCIIFQLITSLYVYIFPFYPDLDLYLESVINFLLPLLIRYVVDLNFEKEQKQDFKDKHIASRIITVIFSIIILLIVSLCSNLFRYWIAVIGSGSMHPTIKVGDAIIVDKYYQKHLDKLKKGDVLVFQIKGTIYTHRIVNIKQDNGNYQILTKGDRKGQAQDDWIVKNEDVVGLVKTKIPAIGRPTVWLNRLLEENRNAKR